MTYGITINNEPSDMMHESSMTLSSCSDEDFFQDINWQTHSSPSDFEVDDDDSIVSQPITTT